MWLNYCANSFFWDLPASFYRNKAIADCYLVCINVHGLILTKKSNNSNLCASKCLIINGTMTLTFQSISAYSGHYRPTDDILDGFLSYLKENGVKLDQVEVIDLHQDDFCTTKLFCQNVVCWKILREKRWSFNTLII